ncbi:MAG: hypothetical protein AAFU80_18805 [Pseudomonadota bacterium]
MGRFGQVANDRRVRSGAAWIVLRIVGLVAVVVAATWGSHELRDALDLAAMPDNAEMVRRAIMLASAAYIALLVLPFVPGAEIGLAMLAAFGASVAPVVYGATVAAMMLSFSVGCIVPIAAQARFLNALHLHKAADLVAQAAPLSRDERLELLLSGAPPNLLAFALRHRYVALAIMVNIPGNVVVGGGGISLMAGLSGLFAPLPTFLALAIAVSPVPIAVMLFGR